MFAMRLSFFALARCAASLCLGLAILLSILATWDTCRNAQNTTMASRDAALSQKNVGDKQAKAHAAHSDLGCALKASSNSCDTLSSPGFMSLTPSPMASSIRSISALPMKKSSLKAAIVGV